MLETLADGMHQGVKMQIIYNCILELEKKVLQHGECFATVKNYKLEEDENAESIEKLRGFITWRKESIGMMHNLRQDVDRFEDFQDKFRHL